MQTTQTNPLDYFDRIFIINLPYRADRRSEMAQQLAHVGLSFDSSNVELFPAVRPESTNGFPSIGARGCFMSHLGVLQKAKQAGYDRILILEDDLDFSSDFNSRIDDVLSNLRQIEWSFFYGGFVLLQPRKVATKTVGIIDSLEPIMTCHFLAIQGVAIVELVDYLEAMLARPAGDAAGGPMHVDGAYSWFRCERPDHVTLLVEPELGHQRPSRTDIHDLNWYDRVVGVRDIVQWLRKLKRKIQK